MKIYTPHFWNVLGIEEYEARFSGLHPTMVEVSHQYGLGFYLAEGDWFYTKEEAIREAERRKECSIKVLCNKRGVL